MARQALSVHVTAKDEGEARLIARTIVEKRLAACVNIMPNVISIYHWDGQVTEDAEVLLVLKTSADLFEALCMCIRSLHSYTTPCIVAMPVINIDADYAAWLDNVLA
jgi:periplasmic divalent cation tolerance protein